MSRRIRPALLAAAAGLAACATPAPEVPSFAAPAPTAGAGADPAAVPAPEGATIAGELRDPLHPGSDGAVEASTAGPGASLAMLQLGIARAQRERGQLRESLDSLPPGEADGPTARKLGTRLAALEAEIRTMSRELTRLTSTP